MSTWSAWTGWEELERYAWALERQAEREGRELSEPIEIPPAVQARALLAEMQRPPWWRDLDRARRELRDELA